VIAAEVALEDPLTLVAVTWQVIAWPTSALWSVYVDSVALLMFTPSRRHW
jgi:hypothetical protein